MPSLKVWGLSGVVSGVFRNGRVNVPNMGQQETKTEQATGFYNSALKHSSTSCVSYLAGVRVERRGVSTW